MSEHEQEDQGQGGAPAGTAVRALAGAAVTGAAAYAVGRALSARNKRDGRSEEEEDDTPVSSEPEDSADDEYDDSADDEYDDSADERDEGSDDEGDEAVEDAPDGGPSRRTGGKRSKLRLASSSALAGAAPALVPIVEGAAGSAGRYVAEHGPEIVRDHVIPQFIDAFEKAS